jgi:hypothetical protein
MALGDNVYRDEMNRGTYTDIIARRSGNMDDVAQKLIDQSESVGVGRSPSSEEAPKQSGGMSAEALGNASQSAQSGSVGGLLTSGGLMAANPYVAGAGLAMQYLEGRQNQKNQDYMQALARRQAATSKLMNTFQNTGRLF